MNSRSTSRYKVIIADDHQFFRDGFEIALKQIDEVKKIAHASNGKEVLKLLKNDKYDLVFMDIKMPEMNGIEACRMIKKNEFMKNIPVLFLTADNDEYTSLSAVEAGGDHFVTKPIRPSILIGMINELIKPLKT